METMKSQMEIYCEELDRKYIKERPLSKKAYEKACNVLPGGDTRTASYFSPYPHFIERGEGAYIFDIDGNESVKKSL